MTFYSQPERLTSDELLSDIDYFKDMEQLKIAFNASNVIAFIINSYRQIVFVNTIFLKILGLDNGTLIYGKRPGEALGCLHSNENIYGCGKSSACKNCNIINIILEAINTKKEAYGEVALTQNIKGYLNTLNMFGKVVPFATKNDFFYIVTLNDISDTVRRRILERSFFHDFINSASAIEGLLEILKENVPDAIRNEMEFIEKSFDDMIKDINYQKILLEAEDNDISLNKVILFSKEVIDSTVKLIEYHYVAKNKIIKIDDNTINQQFKNDSVLIKRILINMLKNALESSNKKVITIGCDKNIEGYIRFWVNNKMYMPEYVQCKIFQRSFSTKGKGRGLGTYSMKLLGEKYLGGKINFDTDEQNGTTFYFTLPYID